MEVTGLRCGWGWPFRARKAHWFDPDTSTSLCGGWMYTGELWRSLDRLDDPDGCRACVKLIKRHLSDAT